jgi:hypothetical protein
MENVLQNVLLKLNISAEEQVQCEKNIQFARSNQICNVVAGGSTRRTMIAYDELGQ